jgi:hypothetical protein
MGGNVQQQRNINEVKHGEIERLAKELQAP